MKYEILLTEAEQLGLSVYETNFRSKAKGLLKGQIIGIDKQLLAVEKGCILAEELGHYHTSVGDILDQDDARNRKHELKAREWSYRRLIPLTDIVRAYKARAKGKHEIAEYLGVTEKFLQDCIDRYTDHYGLWAKVDDQYMVCFDPLGVMEIFPE